MILLEKGKSCAITGHRPEKFSFQEGTNPLFVRMMEWIQKRLIQLIEQGVTTFYIGMSRGIDTWTGELLLELKKIYPEVVLVGVAPFPEQYAGWKEEDKKRYQLLSKNCTIFITLFPNQDKINYRKRNQFLVGMSSYLLAVYDTRQIYSGASMTVNLAKKANLKIITLDSSLLKCSDFF